MFIFVSKNITKLSLWLCWLFFWGDYISDSLPVNFQCPGPLFLNSTSHRNKSLYRDSVQCMYVEKWTEQWSQWRSSLFSLKCYKQSYVNWQNVSLQRPNVPNYVDYYNTSVFLRQSLSKKLTVNVLPNTAKVISVLYFKKYKLHNSHRGVWLTIYPR